MENHSEKTDLPMSQTEFQVMMEKIESSNAGQELYAKKQYRMTQLAAAANILILAIVIYAAATLLPIANTTFQNLNFIMEDMETITKQLAEADLQKMIADIDALVAGSEKGVEEALEKINSMDIDTLNHAIKNLNDTVAPLAKFFNIFN